MIAYPEINTILPLRQRDEQQLFSVNVYPDASYLVAAYLDVLRYYNWRKFCVVYGDEAGEWGELW